MTNPAGPLHPPLPPVEQVRPGVWSIPVPLPNNSLRYVLVYVFETDAGPCLVDAGWNTDQAYEVLAAGLVSIGTRIEEVHGVLVTHIHPDHYGLAGRIREVSGAWVSLHPADAELIPQLSRKEPDPEFSRALLRAGAPPEILEQQREMLRRMFSSRDVPAPDILLEDGARPEVPGWDLTAIWTPGHSPGHLCFWEAGHGLLLSGDHVLPRITPNVPSPMPHRDTLGDFLRSLDRLEAYPASEVLPAHEYRFTDLRGRLAELRDHHEQRFVEVTKALADGRELAWDIAARMHWARPWEEMELMARQAAIGEAMAHLRALARRGVIVEEPGEVMRWRLPATTAVR